MAQSNIITRGRAGWSAQEQTLLWGEVEKASTNGNPLREVFENVAKETGRKPNSIRNYYYISLKEGGAPDGITRQHALPFTPFDENELNALVREILIARSNGVSVRSCVMDMGGGDKSKTLRYQNKYRSVLKNRPEYIQQVMAELEKDGVEFGADFSPVHRRKNRPHVGNVSADESLSRLGEAIVRCGENAYEVIDALCELLNAQKSLV